MKKVWEYPKVWDNFPSIELNERYKELSVAKEEVKKLAYVEPKGRECSEIQLGQSIQIGPVPITHINANHAPQKAKLESKLIHTERGIEFKFDGKECLVPIGVVKLVIYT